MACILTLSMQRGNDVIKRYVYLAYTFVFTLDQKHSTSYVWFPILATCVGPDPCQNGGECYVDDRGVALCRCFSYWDGEYCTGIETGRIGQKLHLKIQFAPTALVWVEYSKLVHTQNAAPLYGFVLYCGPVGTVSEGTGFESQKETDVCPLVNI